jgi:hypothetical protein
MTMSEESLARADRLPRRGCVDGAKAQAASVGAMFHMGRGEQIVVSEESLARAECLLHGARVARAAVPHTPVDVLLDR